MGKIIYEFLEDHNLTKNSQSDDLSILIGKDRFSFLVSDPQQNVVAQKSYNYLKPISSAYPLASGLKDIFRADPLLALPFQNTRIGLVHAQNTLIPEALFSPDQLTTYLGKVMEVAVLDKVRTDRIAGISLYNVYSVSSEIEGILNSFFPKAKIFHGQSAVLHGFHKLAAVSSGHQLFINVHEKEVQVFAFVGKDLLFSNTFPFETSNDFIYYVLLVYDQFKLKPEVVPLTIAGLVVQESEIYRMLYRYIRLLNMVQAPDYYRFPLQEGEDPVHFYFDLYSLKLCE